MQPTNPSRRRLLAGLFAGLFGWLSCGKNPSQAQVLPSAPPADCLSPVCETTLWSMYDGEGNRIGVEHRPSRPLATAVYTFGAQGRVSSVTYR